MKRATLEHIAKQLESLGNPTRLAIFRVLVQAGGQGASVGLIQRELDIPGSTLSHHIAKLVNTELITQNRDGRTLFCCANFKAMDALVAYLQHNCCEGI
ncbi:DNA-binding transcriptional ArsR family regulator [Alteromonadaceae bacterium 2753L.S.0a.02]|nr:DNA-binding transcriptional ArsR family regulator [Alteromonadaceae bacterium 2753L.S.0a.02]